MRWVAFTALLLIYPVRCQIISYQSQILERIEHYVKEDPATVCKAKLAEILLKPKVLLPFVDAIGKPLSGALVGNLNWWGNYDLCMDLKAAGTGLVPCKTYGLVNLAPTTKAMLTWTSCLPLDCKDDFIDTMLDVIDKVITPIADKYDPNNTFPFIHNIGDLEHSLTTRCQTPITYDAGAYIAMIFCFIFIILTVVGSIRGPITNYICWFLSEYELQCGINTDPEVSWTKDVVKETEKNIVPEINVVITNKTADANILLDVQATCQKEVEEKDQDDTMAGYQVTENLYQAGPDPEDAETLRSEDDALPDSIPISPSMPKRDSVKKVFEVIVSVLKCFSIQRNIKMLMDTTTKPGQILCMNGIRSLSIAWIVLAHMYLVPLLASQGDVYQAFKIGSRRSFDIILNGFPAVDSFFVMSGFLVSYLLIKNFKNGRTFDKIAFGYYIHRYIRLTVPYLMVILVQAFLYRQFITGPFADNMDLGYNGCKKYWWTNLLYINNLVPWKQPSQCVGQTWYLANDMQFFIVAPLYIWLLWTKPLIGNLVLWGSVFVSMIAAGISTWGYEFATTPLRAGTTGPEFGIYYTKPYFRIVPYLVGIWGGWIYDTYGKSIVQLAKLKPLAKLILSVQLWAITIAIEWAVVFGTHSDKGIAPFVEKQSSTIPYAIFNRVGWAFALLGQILLCQAGLGGPINSFLSWRGWLPLSRLTYSVYLLHYGINIAWVSQIRHVFSFQPDFQTVVIYLGLIATVNCCSVLLFLLVEQPAANLEKYLLTPSPRKPKVRKEGSNGNVPGGNCGDLEGGKKREMWRCWKRET